LVLLIIILSDARYIEEVLEAFIELGITGASVLHAQGMGEILSHEVPIFAGLRTLFPGGDSQHRLLISMTSDEKAREAVDLLGKICGSLEDRGTGVALTLPIAEYWGLAKELDA
jgi:nitrogen regulatory protein P-II 1